MKTLLISGGDTPLPETQLATRYAKAEQAERRESIVFVTTRPGEAIAGLSNTEVFVWPQDQDRLTMAFLTGA